MSSEVLGHCEQYKMQIELNGCDTMDETTIISIIGDFQYFDSVVTACDFTNEENRKGKVKVGPSRGHLKTRGIFSDQHEATQARICRSHQCDVTKMYENSLYENCSADS